MSKSSPIDHILRISVPWRGGVNLMSECGKLSPDNRITHDEYKSRVSELGKQRAALFTCMTCINTLPNYSPSRFRTHDIRHIVMREIQWETQRKKRGDEMLSDLTAINELIGMHRDDFDRIRGRINWVNRKNEMKKRRRDND